MNLTIEGEFLLDKDGNKTKVLLPFDEFSKIIKLLNKINSEISLVKFKEKGTGSNKTSQRVFGSAKGKYILSPDFDEPLEDFAEYM